jgi:hypothetical protein
MKENLLQIAEYIEALENRLAQVEANLGEKDTKIAELEQRIVELEARPILEPEIEMDWIEEEPEIPEEPKEQEKPEIKEEPKAPEKPAVPKKPEIPQTPKQPEAPKQPEVPKQPEAPAKPAPAASVGSPVADLRQAISLGDRFLFQRELFAQNGELMQKTIEALNNQPNLDYAVAYIDKHFDWDKESSTYGLFLNALHRRFG